MSFPPGDLTRFHDAQNAGVPSALDVALAELRSGGKRSHWIWYVLPQLRSLGRSTNAQLYGIADLAEARAYLADPLLHQRLQAVMEAIREQRNQPGQSLEQLMGGGLDATKTVSSLTLFEAAGLDSAALLLNQIGRRCTRTLAALASAPEDTARSTP